MAIPGFHSDEAAMQQAVLGFYECRDSMKSTMTRLENDLVSAMANNYSGQQAIAFRNLHMRIQEEMTKANAELNLLGDLITEARGNYNAGDIEAYNQMKSVDAMLGGGAGWNTSSLTPNTPATGAF